MKNVVFSQEPIVAVDVGTTKICVIVAQATASDTFDIIGIGKAPSEGLRKGLVVDINKTVSSIKKAVKEAELMAGIKIEEATIGIAGSHVQSINSQGAVPIKKKEVSSIDIANALASAQAIAIPEGQQILHVLPQQFRIDSQEPVHDPRGMFGVRLEVQVHIITGAITSVQNLIKCCNMAGLQVVDVVLEQLASALAVLSVDERDLGVGILDIGGGTSDLALYHNNGIIYTQVIPVAGNHFTNDLALGMRITLEQAERAKKEYGFVGYEISDYDERIMLESVEGKVQKEVARSQCTAILQPRAHELLSIVDHALTRFALKQYIPAGMVLTGGGSMLSGMQELGASIFKMPVRIGFPLFRQATMPSLHSPKYATGYGLILYALQKNSESMNERLSGNVLAKITTRMKSWISDFF